MSSTQNLVLYSTGCVNCQTLKDLLANAGYQFTIETDISKMLKLGFDKVPMLEVAPNKYLDYQEALSWIGGQKNEE